MIQSTDAHRSTLFWPIETQGCVFGKNYQPVCAAAGRQIAPVTCGICNVDECHLQSAPGVGSTFTLYLPQTYVTLAQPPKSEALMSTPVLLDQAAANPENPVDFILTSPRHDQELVEDLVIDDDRGLIRPGDSALLIVEDDLTFARILVDLAHDRGLKALVALRGSSAISLAREYKPGAITLDINLPDMAGWTTLDRLKHDPSTRHIPVHIISGDEDRRRGLALGAMTYLEKSVSNETLAEVFATIEEFAQKRVKKLLVVCTDGGVRQVVAQSLGARDLEIVAVSTGADALATVKQQDLDGILVHQNVEDISPLQLVDEIQACRPCAPPIILMTTDAMASEEEFELACLRRTGIVKPVHSLDRLLDESVLLLHRNEADLRPEQRGILERLRDTDATLEGKKVLVVDDDVRNIFALTSLLEDHHLEVVHAENGRAGIEVLKKTPKIDLVLMDIMMPGMDGYETIKAIRQLPNFRSVPIIALTAKAMKGDREKCIDAGASDYITKPVDLDQLFSVLRVWISYGCEMAQTAGLPYR